MTRTPPHRATPHKPEETPVVLPHVVITVTETLPEGTDFLQWQGDTIDSIAAALVAWVDRRPVTDASATSVGRPPSRSPPAEPARPVRRPAQVGRPGGRERPESRPRRCRDRRNRPVA